MDFELRQLRKARGQHPGVGFRPADGGALEDQGDHAALHVLVDAGERADLNPDTGLFPDLSPHTFLGRLIEFQHPAGWLPCPVVGPADHEDTTVCTDNGPRDGYGV
jgi:hypothetical protein